MIAKEDLDDVAALLYETGIRMCADSMKSAQLSRERKGFLFSWGRLLKENAEWVAVQKEIGVMEPQDILGVVQLQIDAARTYRDRRETVPA